MIPQPLRFASAVEATYVGVGRPVAREAEATRGEPEQFDLDQLARQSEGYTGADIKEVVQMGLKMAFQAGEELGNDQLLSAIPEIRPLSRTDPEAVTRMTKWLDSHTKPAGNGHSAAQPMSGTVRRQRVTV